MRLASAPGLVWIGLMFVFSAACAREYDAEFILHRPWIMLVPLAASLLSSFLLWSLLWFSVRFRTTQKAPFWANYRIFLGLFWLTAPLAWLYSIPYERVLDPVGAVQANYATLGLVAAWRVFLMIRVAQAWLGFTGRGATVLLLWYGCTVLLAALIFAPWPVIDMMGGTRDPAASAEMNIRVLVLLASLLAWPVLVLFLFIQAATGKRRGFPSQLAQKPVRPLSRPLYLAAIASLLFWAPVMAFTQPPLRDTLTTEERREIEREELWRERRAEMEELRVEREQEERHRTNRPAANK